MFVAIVSCLRLLRLQNVYHIEIARQQRCHLLHEIQRRNFAAVPLQLQSRDQRRPKVELVDVQPPVVQHLGQMIPNASVLLVQIAHKHVEIVSSRQHLAEASVMRFDKVIDGAFGAEYGNTLWSVLRNTNIQLMQY